MLSLGTMSIECLDKFVIYVARKTTSWISLILFPALLYCHLLNVELRHNVDGVPRQLCTLPTTPRFTCPHFPSLAFVPFPSASSWRICSIWVTALRRSRKRLRTVANGCGLLRTVANTETTFREHSLTPRPPNETGTLATHSGKISCDSLG